jgi:hypothetical protein
MAPCLTNLVSPLLHTQGWIQYDADLQQRTGDAMSVEIGLVST